MAIEKLADGAIATLGAHQTLTDPAALVKELVDNALDANATSVGGSTLGFRGQALASAAEMSGTLTISTRVEGEQVATALKINQHGEVTGEERASLPVGTTVRVTNFVKANPVRRQRILKDAEKYLRYIKQTLQAYAFARPHVRFALRVLKAKNDKSNYMYAPKPGGSIEEAALKIVGSACVTQCAWTVIEDQGFTLRAFLPRPDGDSSKISGAGTFLSVDGRPVSAARGVLKQLVKMFRDALKESNSRFAGIKDPFMHMSIACPCASYDPNVEPAKDDIIFEDPDTVVELARRMFAAVYPPVESPTSEEARRDRVRATEARETQIVPERELDLFPSPETQRSGVSGVMATPRAPDAALIPTPLTTRHAIDAPLDREMLHGRAFRSNMYGCDEEDVDLMDRRPPIGRTEADFEELRQAGKDVTLSNPFVLAKMNTLLKPSNSAKVGEREPGALPERYLDDRMEAQGLPTPRPSSPVRHAHDFHPSDHVPDIRLARNGRVIGVQALPAPRLHQERPPPASSPDQTSSAGHSIARDPPAYNILLAGQDQGSSASTPLFAIPIAGQRPRRNMPRQSPQTPFNRPFVSPVMDGPPQEQVWFDHLEGGQRTRQKQKRQYQPNNNLVRQGELDDADDPRPLTPPRRNRDIHDFVSSVDLTGADLAASSVHPERRAYVQAGRPRSLSLPRSGEGRENESPAKGVSTARGFMPASELVALEAGLGTTMQNDGAPSSKRRKASRGRALRELSANVPTTERADDGEEEVEVTGGRPASRPRTGEKQGRRVTRTKSSRLPLERIPKGQGTHNLELTLTTSEAEVSRWAGKIDEDASLLGWNQPSLDAYCAFAPAPDTAGMETMATKLHELLIDRVSDGEMVQDLGELVRRAFAEHNVEFDDVESVGLD
ncbi:hypothetical protein LTR53_009570 [Teratosphaeriaceae sp. CCFEE 6253]|nr:hypothetical protein LTR53_009570 [Teratosphaeriaceae sp. CCFEE 6253]